MLNNDSYGFLDLKGYVIGSIKDLPTVHVYCNQS